MIEGIKGENIEAWWPLVEEYLITALEHGLGEYSTGDIRYADGSNWNPGSTGEGVYIYLSTGAWSKL